MRPPPGVLKAVTARYPLAKLPEAALKPVYKFTLVTKINNRIHVQAQSLAGFLRYKRAQDIASLHSGCRYGVTFYDLVISIFTAAGRSADGLCKLVTLRGSCEEVKERRRALLTLEEDKQRRSALCWRRLRPTPARTCSTVAGGLGQAGGRNQCDGPGPSNSRGVC